MSSHRFFMLSLSLKYQSFIIQSTYYRRGWGSYRGRDPVNLLIWRRSQDIIGGVCRSGIIHGHLGREHGRANNIIVVMLFCAPNFYIFSYESFFWSFVSSLNKSYPASLIIKISAAGSVPFPVWKKFKTVYMCFIFGLQSFIYLNPLINGLLIGGSL